MDSLMQNPYGIEEQSPIRDEHDGNHDALYQERKEEGQGVGVGGGADDEYDADYYEEELVDAVEASWNEVFHTCCCHSTQEWAYIGLGILCLLFFLYFFLLGLDLLAASAKVVGGCTAGSLFGESSNPIAGLTIGILATVMLQSSSTTTSIIVSLVGSESIPTRQAIYMIMGANIGTSVTNTIVALGQAGNEDQLEAAFSGATVHDMFNFMTVGILLPFEAATGYLYHLTNACVAGMSVSDDGKAWTGPVKQLVDPLAFLIIIPNRDIVNAVASGGSCSDFYPTRCENAASPTYETCYAGLIKCNKATNKCPAFYEPGASQRDDEVAGGVCFFLALVILIVCLIGLVSILQKMLLGMSTRVIYKATNINGYVAMLIGTGLTVLVQSSSITTSTLTPLVGLGVLKLEQMYPLTLGANLGTTVTALLAALVADTIAALQVALAHLFFNLSGILLFYPIPFFRIMPMNAARSLGRATRIWKGFPVFYIATMFFVLPLSLLGLSALFDQGARGYTVLGSVLVVIIVLFLVRYVYMWNYQGGREDCLYCLQHRARKKSYMNKLPDDMDFVMAKLVALSEHTGLPEDDDEYDGNTYDSRKSITGGGDGETTEG